MSESHDDQSKFRLKKLSTEDAEALIAKAMVWLRPWLNPWDPLNKSLV